MNAQVILLCLCGLALQGALPFVFFRPGRANGGWWLTAAPFLGVAALLLGALAGVVAPLRLTPQWHGVLSSAAVPTVAVALVLIGVTVGAHRVRLSLWHQQDDAPHAIVMTGPYAYVRHPFYTAFILLLIAAAGALPHAGTLVLLGAGTLQLYRTAVREERRLLASSHGAIYASYMSRTGRFMPRLVPAREAPAGSAPAERLASASGSRDWTD